MGLRVRNLKLGIELEACYGQDERKGLELVKCRVVLGDFSILHFMLDIFCVKGKADCTFVYESFAQCCRASLAGCLGQGATAMVVRGGLLRGQA